MLNSFLDFKVTVKNRSTGSLIDSYRLRIGLRELNWDAKGVYVNGKPIYFKGFGRHEDTIVILKIVHHSILYAKQRSYYLK